MNVDAHLCSIEQFGFTLLLGLVAPLTGGPAQIFKYAP